MRTRELKIFIETSLKELEIKKEDLEVEYKKKKYTLKKQARKAFVDLNYVYGQLDSLKKTLKMIKIPSKR